MTWQLISTNEMQYFRFAWEKYAALYSTKFGQDALVHILKPVFLKQVHSAIIIDVESQVERTGDGLVSSTENNLGIKIADCLPVYAFSRDRIFIIHCGWRGIIGGITRKAMKMMGDFHYLLGASIGTCCYEVRRDVVELFEKDHADAIIVRGGKHYLDLKSAVIQDLGAARLLGSLDLCTKCHPELFYSHRAGDTQRNYALIGYNIFDQIPDSD
jgi:YfiH family protein